MTERRLQCLVPFCRRTRGQRKGEPPIRHGEEWICGPHWRLVSPHKKRRRRRLRTLMRRARRLGRESVLAFLHRQHAALWETMKAEAIEAAAGIA